MENHASAMQHALDVFWMQEALRQAEYALSQNEIPVGACLLDPRQTCIARAENRVRRASDPTAHAEICVIRSACAIQKNLQLPGCTLYVTLSPCLMCWSAILASRISRVVIALLAKKRWPSLKSSEYGKFWQIWNTPEKLFVSDLRQVSLQGVQIHTGICASPSRLKLQKFFQDKRIKLHDPKGLVALTSAL